ncbi:excisionase family DNA-binding protein [Elusimicrobiota bacterium]
MPDDILSTGQAAKLCSVTRDTVLKWIKLGKIEAIQTAGGHYRIEKDSLKPYMPASVPVATAQKPEAADKSVSYCWEYHSQGREVRGDCRECMVFKSQARRCYLMAGLGEKAGHSGVHCKDNCYECEYFHFIEGDKFNVLLVTENERLKERLGEEISDHVVLRTACSGYETSAIVHEFKPDFILIDESLAGDDPADICRHLSRDQRVAGAQIVLALSEGSARSDLPGGVCASIAMPFSTRQMEESFQRLRKSLWGGGRVQ